MCRSCCAPSPSLKLSTNTALWVRQEEDIDLNAGTIVDGTSTVAQVGEVVGNDYVVESGLKPGDKLIVSGIQKIADGAPVRVTEKSGPREAGD